MAPPSRKSQTNRIFFAFVGCLSLTACCASKLSSRYTCSSEDWFNFSSGLEPRLSPRQSTRLCILRLLSEAIASRVGLKIKQSEGPGLIEEEPYFLLDQDRHFPHVPFQALNSLTNATFSAKPVEMDCPEFSRGHHNHKPAILSSSIDSDWFVSSSTCGARVVVDEDRDRWPQTILRVECACEEGRCSIRGPHSCITVSDPVNVLRRRADAEGWRVVSEPITVRCICASRRARVMWQSRPHLVRR